MDFQQKRLLSGLFFALLLSLFPLFSFAQLNNIEVDPNFVISGETEATVDSVEIYVEDLIRKNQLLKAHKWTEKGIELAKKINYRKGEFKLTLLKSGQFLNRNITDSTISYSEYALDLAETDFEQKQALNSLGNGHAKAGRSIIAIDLYEQVLVLADSLQNEHYSVGVLVNLATAYSGMGQDDEGLRYFFEALERSERMQNKEFIALITNNLGDRFNTIGNFDQAEYYLKRSREISEREEIISNLVRVHLNLGNLYKSTGRFDEAEESYNKALDMNSRSGNIPGQIQVIYNMGMMYLKMNDYESARDYFLRSLAQSREVNLPMGIYYNTNGLGELDLKMGNYSQAILHYEEAIEIADSIDNNPLKLETYKNIYEAYKQADNSSQALSWLEQVVELNEKLRTFERERISAEFETKFNLRRAEQEKRLAEVQQEQQQAEIEQQKWIIVSAFAGITILLVAGAVLIFSNRKRKAANLKLSESNRQLKDLNGTVQEQKEELERLNNIKTKLFAIVAHDLRGPLGSLQSLLYLLREHDLSEEETNKLIMNLEKNMLENSSMMDNLLGWAQSQMNGISVNKRRFDLKFCLESVLDPFKLQAENKGITLAVEVSQDTFIFADYDLMKLVLRNLIANAIKFSHEGSTIRIGAERKSTSTYKIFIQDSGVGISEEDRPKIFSDEHFTSQGTNREKGSGLGLNLCKEYVEKHGGKIWFDTEEGKGTTFFFTIAAVQKIEEPVKA